MVISTEFKFGSVFPISSFVAIVLKLYFGYKQKCSLCLIKVIAKICL